MDEQISLQDHMLLRLADGLTQTKAWLIDLIHIHMQQIISSCCCFSFEKEMEGSLTFFFHQMLNDVLNFQSSIFMSLMQKTVKKYVFLSMVYVW